MTFPRENWDQCRALHTGKGPCQSSAGDYSETNSNSSDGRGEGVDKGSSRTYGEKSYPLDLRSGSRGQDT